MTEVSVAAEGHPSRARQEADSGRAPLPHGRGSEKKALIKDGSVGVQVAALTADTDRAYASSSWVIEENEGRVMLKSTLRDKVGLVGAGLVGSSFAYALMQSGVANELVLIDTDSARAEGEAMDLVHGMPFVNPMRIRAGHYADLAGSEIVVITAGASQRPGQSRLELLDRNAQVIREVVPCVVAANPDGLILMATNPVDVLTQLASELAGLAPGRVFGTGTIIDTSRFRFLLGEHYGVDPRSVHASIVGEHGDSEVPVWSLANIAGVRLRDFVGPGSRGYDQQALNAIFHRTSDAAQEIIRRKKSTHYAIGLAVARIVAAVLADQDSILTVSSSLHGAFGLRDVALSLPTIVGGEGAEEVLEIPMSDDECAALRASGRLLQEHRRALG